MKHSHWIWNAYIAVGILQTLVTAAVAEIHPGRNVSLLYYKYKGKLLCVTQGTASQSAIYWTGQEPTISNPSEVINGIQSSWNCTNDQGECRSWTDDSPYQRWMLTSSLSTPAPFVTDYRWEKFHTTKTDKDVIKISDVTESKTSWEVGISVLAEQNAHLFLCDGIRDWWYSKCYYIILRGWYNTNNEKSVIRKCIEREINEDPNYSPEGICIRPRDTNKEKVLGVNKWFHFKIIWNNNSNELSVWDYGRNKVFLNYTDKSNPIIVKGIFVRTHGGPGLWKVHTYNYLHTTYPGQYRKSGYSTPTGKKLCLSFQYFLSHESTFVIDGPPNVEFEDYTFQSDHQWHEARIITKEPPDGNIFMKITTVTTGRASSGFFAIGDMRQCNPEGDVRVSTISWTDDRSNLKCQFLQYPGFSLISTKKPSQRNIETEECEDGNIMPDCTQNCKTLLKSDTGTCSGVIICQNDMMQDCKCAAGYMGDDCSYSCSSDKYGPGCSKSCGKCINGCNVINGDCTGGCHLGYRPDKCVETYPKLKQPPVIEYGSSGHRTLTFQINSLEFEGKGDILNIFLEYKNRTDWVWKKSSETLTNKLGLPLLLTIQSLEPATTYIVRAILTDISGKSYEENDVPSVEATTTCDDPTEFQIEEDKRSITIKYMVKDDECPPDMYNVKINNKQGITLSDTFYIRDLEPFTMYNIKILRSDTMIFEKDVKTLQDAPSKVENLSANSITQSTLELHWDRPSKPNGIIEGYVVKFQHIHYGGCRDDMMSNLPLHKRNTTELYIKLDNLLPYSKYIITVQGVTVESGDEETIDIKTEAEDIPAVKLSPGAIKPYKTSTEVSWHITENCTTITAPIKSYRIDIRGTSPWNQNNWTSNNASTQYFNLENLIPYSQYDLKIYILGPFGKINEDLPLTLNFTTKPADPPAVRNLTAYAHSHTGISLRWTPPYPPYGTIKTYTVKYRLKSERQEYYYSNQKFSDCALWPPMICHNLEKVTASQEYIITVSAINENVENGTGHGEEKSVPAVTAESASSMPLDLKATFNTPHWITLTWKQPWLTHGKLIAFDVMAVVNISNLRYPQLKPIHNIYELLHREKNYTFELRNLEPSTHYNVEVNGRSSIKGEISSIPILTPTVEPIFERNVSVVEEKVDNCTIIILLPPAARYLTQKSSAFVVVTLLEGYMPYFEDKSVFHNPEHRNEVLKGITTQNEKMKWIAEEIQLSDKSEEYVVGNMKIYHRTSTKFGNNFKNHPLAPKCLYQISVVALNEEDSKLFSTYTSLAQPVQTRGTPIAPPPANLGLLALLLLLLIPVLIYLAYIKYKKKRTPPADCDDVPLHKPEGSPGGNVGCGNKLDLLGVKVHYKPPIPVPEAEPDIEIEELNEVPGKPISQQLSNRVQINKLEQYVRSSILSGELQRQHALFPRGITQSCEYGRLPENKMKNRYANLTAYDATRVVLKKCNDDEFSNYINANYVEGYKAAKFYIATQGPKPNTIADFWRMVWQEQVHVISMLNNVVESGKKKCEEYWPEACSEVTYGGINIQRTTTEVFADYTIRYLTLTHKGKKRSVQHLHFTSWPDHGVPLYPQSVATYIKKLSAAPKGSGPILVHCSAGVGRTGTIILTDINLRMAAAEGAVDVLCYQQRIREQRPNLVDNVEQYKLVHLVLLECLVEEQTDISCDGNFEACVQDLKNNGGLDRQFMRLNKHKSIPVAETKKPPQVSQMVHHKNRNQDIVPGSLGQIYLTQVSADDPTSTYINAVSVDGFRTKNQFIATQFPLPGTVVDFWRLVHEKRITLIVVLNEVDTSDKTIVEFRPTKDNPLHPLSYIEVKQNQVYEYEYWNLHFLQMTDTSLQDQPRQEPIRLLQYKGWHSSQNLPPSTTNLLMLWKETERVYMGKGPFLVTCRDGAKSCGLFLALSFLVEKVKLEQICNVCQAVRTVRQPRNQFIATQDQFEFLYNAVVSYLEEFQTYANFH